MRRAVGFQHGSRCSLYPRNLSDMDTKFSFCKLLKLHEVRSVQEEWNLYRSTDLRTINSGDDLLAWRESGSRPPFKRAIPFLLTIPTSIRVVQRVFRQAGNVSKTQHKLPNHNRRLAFMARFHLDVEARFLPCSFRQPPAYSDKRFNLGLFTSG